MDTSPTQIDRRQLLAGLGATTALSLSGCAATIRPGAIGEANGLVAKRLLDTVAWNLLKLQPERATSLGVDTGEYAALRGRLSDASPAGKARLAAQLSADLAAVRAQPRDGLDTETVTNLEVVESAYSTAVAGLALPYGDIPVGSWRTAPYVVIQNVGAYNDMPRSMESDQPLETAADAEFYLSRLEGIPTVLAGELERITAARAMGVIPPDFLLDKADTAMSGALRSAMAGEAYTAPFRARLKEKGLSERYADRAASIEKGSIAEGLERQLAELRTQRARAKSHAGLWAQPRGDEWYAWSLRSSTTTNRTPEQIHQQGLDELAALHGRMDPILRGIGYTQGSVGARMQALSEDPRYKFAPGDPGRKEIMDFIWDRVNWIKAQMPRAFNTLVDPNMEVKRLPLAEEPTAPGAYGGAGSKDGKIPGRFWINLHTTDLHRKYDLADLTFHESIPGHIWEGEYSNRLPLIRSILGFNAFSEGWALYAQQLADELGAYKDFKVGQLGFLQSLAFRACRLVVDTGLHTKRWTREQGRAFFVEQNGNKPEEVASEVDRYCSWAGQACGYKIGHTEIVLQRARALTALGPRYDLRGFNDAVILGGNAPLDVMAKNVDRYIAAAGQA